MTEENYRKGEIHLSSLEVGRAFRTAGASDNDNFSESSATGTTYSKSFLDADEVYKITGSAGGKVVTLNAAGEEHRFPEEKRVFEVAREGYDRLVQRARDGD